MLSCLVVSYTQRPSGFKAIIKSIFKTNLPSLTSLTFPRNVRDIVSLVMWECRVVL
jgi:hypothetical protein